MLPRDGKGSPLEVCQVTIRKTLQWTIVGNVFGESHVTDLFCGFQKGGCAS